MLELLLTSSYNKPAGFNYRYIMIDEITPDSGNLSGFIEILVMSPSGINLCRKNGATATASSFYDSGLRPSYLIDGDLMSRWVSATTGPQWVKIDLKVTGLFDSIKFYALMSEAGRVPKSFKIKASVDNVTYDTLGVYTGVTYPDVIATSPWKINGVTMSPPIP